MKGIKVAILSGTGRMGVHLGAAWAAAGMDVTLCSREKQRAERIVHILAAGHGWTEDQCTVPKNKRSPTDEEVQPTGWVIKAGSIQDAADADVIALGSPFHVMWPTLEQIADAIRGKGKIIIDMTNPWLNQANQEAQKLGIPADKPQSSALYHQQLLNDPTAKWAHSYRHLFWVLIHPGGLNPKSTGGNGIEVLGDPEAVEMVSNMIVAHGFRPVFRGGLELTPQYEISTSGRVQGGASLPEKEGGLAGPFTAGSAVWSEMIFGGDGSGCAVM